MQVMIEAPATSAMGPPSERPGTRARSETSSVATNTDKVAPARASKPALLPWSDRSGDTLMATKSSPTNAPPTPAAAVKNPSNSVGTLPP